MKESFFVHSLSNGLTLVAQRMEQVASASLTLALPAGSAYDPPDALGAGSVAAEWLFRGAAGRSSRQLNDELDALGVQHGEETHSAHLLLSASLLGRSLGQALALYADIVRRPTLADDSFGPCRDLVSQALDGLEDEPMRKCNLLVRERFYPPPLGRNPLGDKASLAAMTPEHLRGHLGRHLSPRGSILAVAGAVDFDKLRDAVEQTLGDWRGQEALPVAVGTAPGGPTHLDKPTAQQQITLAYPAAVIGDATWYYPARMAQMVLSGGMSSRLFTEVREKRGLVYSVSARYHSLKQHAGMFVYAGTQPHRAQETFEVTLRELRKLADGIDEAEMARARTQLKSALVMQGESTGARADALCGDWHHLGRLRGLRELSDAVDAVTSRQVLDYVRAFPPAKLTVLTIGPQALNTSGAE